MLWETLRLYSPVLLLNRTANRDEDIGGYFIPKGVSDDHSLVVRHSIDWTFGTALTSSTRTQVFGSLLSSSNLNNLKLAKSLQQPSYLLLEQELGPVLANTLPWMKPPSYWYQISHLCLLTPPKAMIHQNFTLHLEDGVTEVPPNRISVTSKTSKQWLKDDIASQATQR